MSNFKYDFIDGRVIIHDGVTSIPGEYFKDNLDIVEVYIPDSVFILRYECFKGCSNLKIVRLPDNIKMIEFHAFSNCISLEEIRIPSSLNYFAWGLFYNCYNLKTISNYELVDIFEDECLFNCKSLEDFVIPKNTLSIGYKAFMHCDLIESIHIPRRTHSIGVGAFGFMSSLSSISLDKDNKCFYSDNNIALIDKNGTLLQYAINSDKEEYNVGYFGKAFENFKIEQTDNNIDYVLMENIANYAFAGAKKLKKININSRLDSFFENTFLGCDNLTDLELYYAIYGSHLDIDIFNKAHIKVDNVNLPFKNIVIDQRISSFSGNSKLILNNSNKLGFTKDGKVKHYDKSIFKFFNSNCSNEEIINIDKLIIIYELLKKYQVDDPFLYNYNILDLLSNNNLGLLIKYYNKNIKRIIISSKCLDKKNNFNDLITFCNAMGVFCDDDVFSQKVSTFINEKLMSIDNAIVIGDNIHSIFNEINARDEVDFEFSILFMENYKKLIDLEVKNSGIIARIYNNFRNISSASTTHRGFQRHLKVTLDKCLDYFIVSNFISQNEINSELAKKLIIYYTEDYSLTIGEQIISQSLSAPRNIFGNEDLLEDNDEEFKYHWLPKQDYNNLVLGKYCNCCAHLLGAGAGLMRASMTLDNCQNLVIKNNDKIVAKMTIYVNKEEGYGVFNTTEISLGYVDFIDEIYDAFMRGVNDFVRVYNNFSSIPINIITIGSNRNKFIDYLEESELLPTPDYSNYGYYYNNISYGTYSGDDKENQLLVLKVK